jgi:hypothetical protein
MSLQLEGETIQIIDAHTHMGRRPRRERFEILASCFTPNITWLRNDRSPVCQRGKHHE